MILTHSIGFLLLSYPLLLFLLLHLLILLRSASRCSTLDFLKRERICRQMPAPNFTEFEKYAPQTLKHLFLSSERCLIHPPATSSSDPTYLRAPELPPCGSAGNSLK